MRTFYVVLRTYRGEEDIVDLCRSREEAEASRGRLRDLNRYRTARYSVVRYDRVDES